MMATLLSQLGDTRPRSYNFRRDTYLTDVYAEQTMPIAQHILASKVFQ